MTSNKKSSLETDKNIHELAAELADIAENYFAVYGSGSGIVPLRQDDEAKKLRAGRAASDNAVVKKVGYRQQ